MLTFYHISPTRNKESIMESGIIPQIGDNSKLINETISQVYLFNSPEDLTSALGNWLGEMYNEDEMLTIFQIEIDPNDKFLKWQPSSEHYESYYRDTISPDMIVRTFHEEEFLIGL